MHEADCCNMHMLSTNSPLPILHQHSDVRKLSRKPRESRLRLRNLFLQDYVVQHWQCCACGPACYYEQVAPV